MPGSSPNSPDATPPARLSWQRGRAAGEAVADLIGVRPDAVVLLTDTPVPTGWPVRVGLGGSDPAGPGPSASATVLAATALGTGQFLLRLGLVDGRGAAAFLRVASTHLDGGAQP